MRELTKNGEGNVDKQVDAAATLKEHTHGRENDGKDDLANVSVRRKRQRQ